MTNAGPPRNPGLGPGDLEFRARGFRSVGIRVDRDRCLGLYRIWALTPGVRGLFLACFISIRENPAFESLGRETLSPTLLEEPSATSTWRFITRVIGRVAIRISHMRGLITPQITSHEAPSRVPEQRKSPGSVGLGF